MITRNKNYYKAFLAIMIAALLPCNSIYGVSSVVASTPKVNSALAPITLDLHPIVDSSFKPSAGMAYKGNKIKANSNSQQRLNLGKVTYTKEKIDIINARLSPSNKLGGIAPLSYDGSFIENGVVSFRFESGLKHPSKSKTKGTKVGTATDDLIKNRIKAEAAKKMKTIDKVINFFPIICIGFKFAL